MKRKKRPKMFKYDCDTCTKWHKTDLAGAWYLIRNGWPFGVAIMLGKKRLQIFRGWANK